MSALRLLDNLFVIGFWVLVLSGIVYPRILPSNAGKSTTGTGRESAVLENGMVVSHPVRPSDLYSIYRQVQEEYLQKASGSSWKVLNQVDGVQVAMLEHPSSSATPYIRMKAIIPVSVHDTWNFLRVSNWDRTMPKMDPFYESVSTLSEHNHRRHSFKICRKTMKRILMFDPRDLVFISVTQDDPLPDGTLVSGTVSVQTPLLPRTKGYVRAFQDSIATYKPLDASTTELTIICRIDLNDHTAEHNEGMIPMWLYVKTIGITGAQSVIRMRNALLEESKARGVERDLVSNESSTERARRKFSTLNFWKARSGKLSSLWKRIRST